VNVRDRRQLNAGDMVVVTCDRQCDIRLVDDSNLERYKSGSRHQYLGGFYSVSPVRIVVPSAGYWNVALYGGGGIGVKCDVEYIPVDAAEHAAAG